MANGVSSASILAAIKGLHKGGNAGRAEALRRQTRTGMNGSTATSSQRQFFDDLAKMPPPPKREVYLHPGDQLPAAPQVPAGAGRAEVSPAKSALDDSDREWLRRLPTDPSKVAWEDARALLTLQSHVTNPSDRRLLDAVARPVRQFHDEGRALADERNAQLPMPLIPPSALGALSDAIAAEVPQLQPHEAAARAADQIAEVAAQRAVEREQELRNAQTALVDLARQASDRAAVIKGAPRGVGGSDPEDRDRWVGLRA